MHQIFDSNARSFHCCFARGLLLLFLYLPSATVVAKGYVFTGVCLSKGGGGVHLPGRHPSEMAAAADRTHPTGIHSCL